MNWTRFALAISLAAAGYVTLIGVGLAAMRGEVGIDPLWPTLGAVSIIVAVMAGGWWRVFRAMRQAA